MHFVIFAFRQSFFVTSGQVFLNVTLECKLYMYNHIHHKSTPTLVDITHKINISDPTLCIWAPTDFYSSNHFIQFEKIIIYKLANVTVKI